jgi:hypothetical protein
MNKTLTSIHKHQFSKKLQFPVITPETELMMSNLQHGCCTKRSSAMDAVQSVARPWMAELRCLRSHH